MRFTSLTLGAGKNAATIEFHPKLTVVAGVGPVERDVFAGELLGALSGTRRGTKVVLTDDNGLELVVDRRDNADADVARGPGGEDVTARYALPTGRVDLLQALGIDLDTARKRCRLNATDIAAASKADRVIDELAGLNQAYLWSIATQLVSSDKVLKTEAEIVESAFEDAPVIELIEERHQASDAAAARYESVRHHGIIVGGISAIAAIPATLMIGWTGLCFLVVAAVFAALSITTRRSMEKAAEAEAEALEQAGTESYIGFHIARMNQLLEGQRNRERLASAAKAHRESTASWGELVGELDVEWALANRDKIEAVALRLTTGGATRANHGPDLTDADPAELAQALITRLAELRKIGKDGQSLPLILDEPLKGVPLSVKQWMLELIGRSAGSPQVLLFTSDPDIAAWAKMEAMAGQLSIIAPGEAAPKKAAATETVVVSLDA